jgi:hypothetical protein
MTKTTATQRCRSDYRHPNKRSPTDSRKPTSPAQPIGGLRLSGHLPNQNITFEDGYNDAHQATCTGACAGVRVQDSALAASAQGDQATAVQNDQAPSPMVSAPTSPAAPTRTP